MKATAPASRSVLSSASSELKSTILERQSRILARYLADWSERVSFISSRACRAMSQTVGASSLNSSASIISDSISKISLFLNFLREILSQTTASFSGWISSYLAAANIVVTPMRWRSLTSRRVFACLRQASMKQTLRKKVSSLILYEESTSIIQSTIFERSELLISCRSRMPAWLWDVSQRCVRMSEEQSRQMMSVQTRLRSWPMSSLERGAVAVVVSLALCCILSLQGRSQSLALSGLVGGRLETLLFSLFSLLSLRAGWLQEMERQGFDQYLIQRLYNTKQDQQSFKTYNSIKINNKIIQKINQERFHLSQINQERFHLSHTLTYIKSESGCEWDMEKQLATVVMQEGKDKQ